MSSYYHNFKNDEFADKNIFKKKENGYFVEVGAVDGITESQCYFFEKNRKWDGIAVEPNKDLNSILKKNRKNACIKCLGNKKGLVEFTQSNNKYLSAVTEVMEDYNLNHNNTKTDWKKSKNIYHVEMITLLDLFEEYNSPLEIDFLGMDCEGSEYNILEHYFSNNKKYKIKFIALEICRKDLVDMVIKNNYIEVISPYLKNIKYKGREITWERYFIHESEINNIDKNLIKK